MKIVYSCSKWTTASRSAKTHADDGTGKPVCGHKGRGIRSSWVQDEGRPTCEKCIRMIER